MEGREVLGGLREGDVGLHKCATHAVDVMADERLIAVRKQNIYLTYEWLDVNMSIKKALLIDS